MVTIIFIVAYIAIGFFLVQGTLFVSQYNIGDKSNKWRILSAAILAWPIFILLMCGYWGWALYHNFKHWIKSS